MGESAGVNSALSASDVDGGENAAIVGGDIEK